MFKTASKILQSLVGKRFFFFIDVIIVDWINMMVSYE